MNQEEKPHLISGGVFNDERGSLRFINTIPEVQFKRFYQIKNSVSHQIRAFQCHRYESRYLYLVSGKILVIAAFLDKKTKPSQTTSISKFILTENESQLLYIPAGYANGFKALEPNSRVLFFSSSVLNELENDSFRLPADYWGKNIWEIDAKS